MKSLVVEDDFFGRLVLQRILQTVGRWTCTAVRGLGATQREAKHDSGRQRQD